MRLPCTGDNALQCGLDGMGFDLYPRCEVAEQIGGVAGKEVGVAG